MPTRHLARLTALAMILVAPVLAQGMGHGQDQGHGPHRHGAGGMMMHDEMTMPGLRGLDATPGESAEMAVMFRNFPAIHRSVELLADGIRTVTGSDDPVVMEALASHVTGMIARVEEGRDPQVFIQSPTLDIFFERGAALSSDIEITDGAIIVTQTTDDPELLAALHIHAAEVTAMADRGMAAVHEMMMQRGQ
jgi:hypothetical protein